MRIHFILVLDEQIAIYISPRKALKQIKYNFPCKIKLWRTRFDFFFCEFFSRGMRDNRELVYFLIGGKCNFEFC